MSRTPEQWLGLVLLVSAAATVLLWRPVGWLLRLLRWTYAFLEDWHGRPAVDGREPVPGVMAQLESHGDHLARIDHELQYNSGQSVKDQVRASSQLTQRVAHGQEVLAQAMRAAGMDVPDLAGGA